MASGTTSLRFQVEIDADKATDQLRAITQAVNQAGAQVRAVNVGIGSGARSAAKEIGGLTGAMREYAREQRGQSRVASYFVGELSSIISVSGAAKDSIGGLVAALAGGFGFGMAIDLAITGIRSFVAQSREQEEATKRARTLVDQERESFLALRDAQTGIRMTATPEGRGRALEENRLAVGKEWTALYDKQARAQLELNELKKKGATPQESLAILGRIQNLEEQRATLRDKEAAQAARINATYDAQEVSRRTELSLIGNISETQKIRLATEGAIELAQFRRSRNLIDEVEKEYQVNKALRERDAALEAIANKQQAARALASGASLEEIDRAAGATGWSSYESPLTGRPQTATDILRSQQEFGGFTASEYSDSFAGAEVDMAGTADMHAAAAESAKRHQAEVEKLAATYTMIGQTAASAMTSVIFGQQSLEQAAKMMAQSILQMALNAWIQQQMMALAKHQFQRIEAAASVTRSAGEAGAAAAAQSAPLLGPAAPAEGATVAAAVLSMFGPMASAAGGWKVPRDTLALLHRDEHVLPKRIAKNYEGDAPGRSAPLIGQIVTPNAESFAREVLDHTSALARATKKLQRQRRGA